MFNRYNLVCEGIFKAASVEELAQRRDTYVKGLIDRLRTDRWSQNVDGSWDVDDDVYISDLDLHVIPIKFNKVSGRFSCSHNKLTSLEGVPKEVGGDFYCHGNNLITLENGPKKVSGSFSCDNNKLISLKDAPNKVDGSFYCYNNKLTSLEGSPEEVGGDFYCWHNRLTSLNYAPKEVGKSFNCKYNSINFTKEDVRKVCKVGGTIDVQ